MKIEQLIVHPLVFSCLKGVCSRDSIFTLNLIVCLIAPLDRDK